MSNELTKTIEAVVCTPLEDGARMDAYYYGFDRTGVGIIDRILSTLAQAGKAYHHTESWDDEMAHDYGLIQKGETCADAIQRAADDAAFILRAMAREAGVATIQEGK